MVKHRGPKNADLKKIFLGLQKEMALKLGNARTVIGHPVAKGDVTENSWREMLGKYLPKRYAVKKAFIVDSEGNQSDQIDLVIFDQHFSPMLLHEEDAYYIPAESVYAVFEIKQEVSKKELAYAGKKAKSVRQLKRTSTHITHIGGRNAPVVPKGIIAGLLSLKTTHKSGFSAKCVADIKALPDDQRLNLICALEHGSVTVAKDATGKLVVDTFPPEQALIQFFLGLLSQLQAIGSVPAIDIKAYGKFLAS